MTSVVQQAQHLNQQGLAFAERQDFARAWQCYSEAIRLHPSDAAFYHNRGSVSYSGGHLRHALQDFDESLRLDPHNAETLAARALTHDKLAQDDQALADYERSLQIDPQAAVTWSNRGTFFADRGDWQRAGQDWNEALRLRPDYARYWFLVGQSYCERGLHEQAFPFLDRAIALGEREPRVYMWRGLCRRWRNDLAGAIADMNVALQIKPDHFHSLYYRADIHYLAGNFRAAFDDYTTLIRLGDDGYRVRKARAELFLKAGKSREAWEELDAALKFELHDLDVFRLRAQLLRQAGREPQAEHELQRMDAAARDRLQSLRPRGQTLWAALVQANYKLYEPGDSDEYCFVLFSFDPAWNSQPARLQVLADIVKSLKGTQPVDPKINAIAAMVSDEAAMKYRRRELPMSVTEGATIFYADLEIYRRFLPSRALTSGQLLAVLAEPGDAGRVELLPPD